MERTFLWVMACVVMASARSLHAGNIISVTSGESIQAAIDIAVDGTLIQVGPGLYTENIDFLGKNISVVATNGSAATTLAAPGSLMPIVTITNAAEMNDILFEGFTVTGGNVESNGAGIFINDADPVIRGCSIENNTALLDGGGVYINGGAEPVFEECLFTGNDADRGGAVYAESATPVYKDCIFRNNTASRGAGMANIGGSSPMVIQCLFHDNVASAFGGGMYNAGGSDPAMIQCTFSRNGAFTGGGMYLDGSGATSVNSIYWDNTDTSGTTSSAQINVQAGTPIVTSSIVQGGFAGAGNLNADPLFENPVGGDFQIADFSPAIDAGDNTAVPMSRMVDLDDNPRFVDDEGVTDTGIGTAPIVDIGVFEHQINSELMFIAVPATFGLIQEAINAAGPNAVIEISAGTYNETL
ncbi:MAG: right-handed parallel beta-helix repeat-containing protein, partial [Planctomycetota bacterium]